MRLHDAIQTYHDLLTDEVARECQAALDLQLRGRGLYFGDRPLCTVLRPRFITPEQYRFVSDRSRLLLRAFDRAYRAALADRVFRAQFGLLDWEEELVQHDPGFRAPSPTSRLDAFFDPEVGLLRYSEYNAETPAAAAYTDMLGEIFLTMPVMREFMRHYELRPIPARHGVLHALLDAYHQWAGRREPPRIAILDWKEVPTYSEFVLFQQYFSERGLQCVIADPREVEYARGRLWAEGAPVDLIYKRVLISELVDRGGRDHAVVRAVREGAVCMVNPFRCKILHKKASLAVLSDERNAPLFTAEERRAIDAHIPWTRRVEERKATYQGQTVDLIPFILESREQFVLKANDEYGGRGITLGWETDGAAWEGAVQAGLAEPTVVQERVVLPTEPFPSMVEGKLAIFDRMIDIDPFVVYGAYVEGAVTRLSTAALLNVTAGGGSTNTTFLIERR
ncbi:MAG: hypothetical protein ACRDF5_09390 [bacterium]